MDLEKGAMCEFVVDFLLGERYFLVAFELLHELLENGIGDANGTDSNALSKLQRFFADPEMFPPDQLSELQNLQGCEQLHDENMVALEKAAILDYELQLAHESIKSFQKLLGTENKACGAEVAQPSMMRSLQPDCNKLEPLGTVEKKDLNRAVKEYLVAAGYKLTAITFCEEVVDQDLDERPDGHIPNALCKFYHCFHSVNNSNGKDMTLWRDREVALLQDMDKLQKDKQELEAALETAAAECCGQRDQLQQLNGQLEEASQRLTGYKEQIDSLQLEIKALSQELENQKAMQRTVFLPQKEKAASIAEPNDELAKTWNGTTSEKDIPPKNLQKEKIVSVSEPDDEMAKTCNETTSDEDTPPKDLHDDSINARTETPKMEEYKISDTMDGKIEACQENKDATHDLQTIQVLGEALPKIVPYVLINHREELLPLMICAIGRHPDSNVRDSLTHLLFNLIKRPDSSQRRIIMDACISLSKCIGEVRTEIELLPQCWEQINHKYEERRLLVAQSCGELGKHVKSDMRSSLILSILEQLIEDTAAVVREAAAQNLAMLLPLFPNVDKYFKVEKILFHLVRDPSGTVVEITLKELLPALLKWGRSGKVPLVRLLQSLLSFLLSTAKLCPPMSGVEGSAEAQLRILGERERWNLDTLLQMLIQLLPEVQNAASLSCPCLNATIDKSFSDETWKTYFRGTMKWPEVDWLVLDLLPAFVRLACMLSSREESLRKHLCSVMLHVKKYFGEYFGGKILLPALLAASGKAVDTRELRDDFANQIESLKPQTPTEEKLAIMCLLPLLLGVLVDLTTEDVLHAHLKDLVLESSLKHGAWSYTHTPELIEAVRFLCTSGQQEGVIMNVCWDLIVHPSSSIKVTAAVLLKELVAFVDLKRLTQQLLPALVTLGSDPNLDVKYSTIYAFGSVAQHFHDEMVEDKVRVQMDAFFDEGSHEGAMAVVRALTVAVPFLSDCLKDYLLQKLLLLTTIPSQVTTPTLRQERVRVFYEAICALERTDISAASVRELLLPCVQNLLKDPDCVEQGQKTALESILKDRSAGKLETISRVMSGHLGVSSMTGLFGEGMFSSKRDELQEPSSPQPPQQDESRLKRMMRTNFGDMIRGNM